MYSAGLVNFYRVNQEPYEYMGSSVFCKMGYLARLIFSIFPLLCLYSYVYFNFPNVDRGLVIGNEMGERKKAGGGFQCCRNVRSMVRIHTSGLLRG